MCRGNSNEKPAPQKTPAWEASDGDDQSNVFWFEILIPGFFCVGNFGKYLLGWLDLRRDSFWVFQTI